MRDDAADESLATAQVTPLGEDSDALPWRADLLSHLFVQDSAMARCVVAREPPLGLPVYLGAHLAVLEAGDLQVNILGDSASLTPVALEYLCLALGGGSSMLFLGNVFLTAPEIAQEGRFDARACSSAGLPPGSITVLGGSRLGIQTSATSASSSSSRVSARSIQVSESSAIVSSGKLQISGMAEVESTVLSVGTDLRCQPLPKDQSMLRANILLVREFSSVCIGDQSKIQAPYTLPPSGCPTEVAFHVACTGRRGARTRPGGAGAGAGAGAGFLLLRVQGFQESGVDFAAEGFLAPTNADEHILCWAMHLARAPAQGGCGRPVSLLTTDLALKIKAHASGVACNTTNPNPNPNPIAYPNPNPKPNPHPNPNPNQVSRATPRARCSRCPQQCCRQRPRPRHRPQRRPPRHRPQRPCPRRCPRRRSPRHRPRGACKRHRRLGALRRRCSRREQLCSRPQWRCNRPQQLCSRPQLRRRPTLTRRKSPTTWRRGRRRRRRRQGLR